MTHGSTFLATVADHYHRTLCSLATERSPLPRQGLTTDVARTFTVGLADGSLLAKIPKTSELREELINFGLITRGGHEALADCLVVPLPDPTTGECVGFCGIKDRGPDIYVPSPPHGVLNYQAAKGSTEVVLVGSVLDALSLYQAGIRNAIPIYGSGGLTSEHLDLFKREGVRSVVLLFPLGATWRSAKRRVRERLEAIGVKVRVAAMPKGSQSANHVLRKYGHEAGDILRTCLGLAATDGPMQQPAASTPPLSADGQLRVQRGAVEYHVRPYPILLGRLRATIRAEREGALHIDTVDLYASRARADFAKRAGKALNVEASDIEADLLALLIDAEKALEQGERSQAAPGPPPMTDNQRQEARAFLRRPDLLDQAVKDMDVLGYVGEEANKRLLYLVSISRKLPSPLSAVILSQSGAGKSGLSDVIERLTPEEDVLFLTRLSPQSLFYSAPDFLNQKLVIIEERAGSSEADYPVRAIQSRGRLSVAVPARDPETGETRTRTFTVQARASFIESSTETGIHPENGSRCFEVSMDESEEQTARVHERQRLIKTDAGLKLRQDGETIVSRHRNAQRLLDPAPVVIPYARLLTFPTAWMRTRRDNARFLNLIEVSAFLHQHQRERSAGAIVATIDDYRIAYELAASVLAETLTDLKRPLRLVLDRVRDLAREHGGRVSRRQVREALQLPDTSIRRWLRELVDLEYLAPERPKPGEGRSTAYTLEGPSASEKVPELLTPEQLAERINPPTRQRVPNRRGGVHLTEVSRHAR
jgi:DNA primase